MIDRLHQAARPVLLGTMLLTLSAPAAAQPLSRSFQDRTTSAQATAPATAGLAAPMPPATAPAGKRTGPVPIAPPATPGGSTVASRYMVSAGDQLDIYVWGDERLQRTLSVLPDGTFAFPLAGTVLAAGKTPNAIEAELSGLLAAQYKGVAPQVTVSVRQPSGMQVSIIGKVRTPSTIAPTRYVTVLDALALVGGPSEFADINNIVVLRRVGGRNTVLPTHLANVLKGRPGSADLTDASNPPLMAGDTVVVP